MPHLNNKQNKNTNPIISRQEYLTSRKEYVEPRRTQDQALSLWSGSTDSKTLDYQRSNPRECQIVRTHTKETTVIQDWHHPTTNSILCRTFQLNNKQNKNTNPIISRQDYHLTQPYPSEEKQINKNSAQISPYNKLTKTTGPKLEDRNQKEERIQP